METIIIALGAIAYIAAGIFLLWDYSRTNVVRLGDFLGILLMGGFIAVFLATGRLTEKLRFDVNPVLWTPKDRR